MISLLQEHVFETVLGHFPLDISPRTSPPPSTLLPMWGQAPQTPHTIRTIFGMGDLCGGGGDVLGGLSRRRYPGGMSLSHLKHVTLKCNYKLHITLLDQDDLVPVMCTRTYTGLPGKTLVPGHHTIQVV